MFYLYLSIISAHHRALAILLHYVIAVTEWGVLEMVYAIRPTICFLTYTYIRLNIALRVNIW